MQYFTYSGGELFDNDADLLVLVVTGDEFLTFTPLSCVIDRSYRVDVSACALFLFGSNIVGILIL